MKTIQLGNRVYEYEMYSRAKLDTCLQDKEALDPYWGCCIGTYQRYHGKKYCHFKPLYTALVAMGGNE